MKLSRLAWIVLLLLLLLAVAGLSRLFDLRLATGDIYPPYSSLRADPLGTKGLHESLARLPGYEAQRNYRSWRWIKPEPGATWFFLGLDREQFQLEWPAHRQTIEDLLARGGRLVIAFRPEFTLPTALRPSTMRAAARKARQPDKAMLSLEDAWGFQFSYQTLPSDDERYAAIPASRVDGPETWPEQLDWHSAIGLTSLAPEWRVHYRCDTNAVLVERPLGQGTLVLMTDSYLFSNEALRWHRASPLLAWLAGPSQVFIFDEAHLGVVEEPSIGGLLRQYRLQGVLAVCLVLALLYIWQNAFPLLPFSEAGAAPSHITGRDTTQGFINLLRRAIPPRQLPLLCYREWREASVRRLQPARQARMEAVLEEYQNLPPRAQDPLAAYRRLMQLASEKSWPPAPAPAKIVADGTTTQTPS